MSDIFTELGEASRLYAEQFGEQPPFMEMPDAPKEQLRLIQLALDTGNAFQANLPEGAVS
jgi:hypothetical protein